VGTAHDPTRRTVGSKMLNTSRNRALAAHVVDPVARGLLAVRLTPTAVSLVGATGVTVVALTLFPRGEWLLGTGLVLLFALSDLLDGTMARLSGTESRWGAFLDSTLDRITDAALSLAVLLAVIGSQDVIAVVFASVSLVGGQVVPYAKARAESLGISCDVGIAERAERVGLILLATLFAGLGINIAFVVILGVLATLTVVTVVQRVLHVRTSILRSEAHGNDI
jgi:CDP-diacylglycerol---glycerol-3-phosphate 3-phosphatidyltransferase